jgi:hypothetical protein
MNDSVEASDRRGVLRDLATFWGFLTLGLGLRSISGGPSLKESPVEDTERETSEGGSGVGQKSRERGSVSSMSSNCTSPRIEPPRYSVKRRERET